MEGKLMNIEESIDVKIPEPVMWYCPACKRLRTKEYPNGRDTILGVQHGDTLVIKHKDFRVEIEAEGRISTTCRACGASVEVFSSDWIEVKKFLAVLKAARDKEGPPIVEKKVIGYALSEG